MSIKTAILPAVLLSGALAAAAPVAAQAQQTQAGPAAAWREHGAHVEGHIAFLKAELGIAPAQEPLWAAVAAAMRQDVAELEQARKAQPATPPNAVQRLERRAAIAALRAKGEQRFLDAFRPLYAALSEAQKRTADELIGHAPRPAP